MELINRTNLESVVNIKIESSTPSWEFFVWSWTLWGTTSVCLHCGEPRNRPCLNHHFSSRGLDFGEKNWSPELKKKHIWNLWPTLKFKVHPNLKNFSYGSKNFGKGLTPVSVWESIWSTALHPVGILAHPHLGLLIIVGNRIILSTLGKCFATTSKRIPGFPNMEPNWFSSPQCWASHGKFSR